MSGTRIHPTTRWPAFVAASLLAMTQAVSAVTITFDYTFDTMNFFDLGDPLGADRRTALETAGAFFESRLSDNLSAITPGGNDTWTAGFTNPGTGFSASVSNRTLALGEILIFAGARDLGGSILGKAGPGGFSTGLLASPAFVEAVSTRGQGLVSTPDPPPTVATDFGPWGGGLTMDIDTVWNYEINTTPTGNEHDFLSVALHEIGHILGIGTADSWDDMINGSNE